VAQSSIHGSTTRTLARKQYKWRIYRIHSRPTEFLGSVTASDEESALEKAANVFRIADSKLTAIRVG
jgi:1,2-phenylacetyl-CoA epoxidase PaaB subunit